MRAQRRPISRSLISLVTLSQIPTPSTSALAQVLWCLGRHTAQQRDGRLCAKPGFPNGYGLVQGEANAVAAGSRPLSSMTPTLVFKEGKPWVATGSPGGSRIITAVAQTLLNLMAFDMTLGMATSSPEFTTSGCLIWRWSSPASLPTRSISSRRASTKSCAQTAQSAA